ncbi:MAG TPA: hypothetical protein VG123_11375 [Streptosporangiaceae bacterium]|nr:hypothetical protein [Streptosporangiaceae bacterium]
MAARRDAAWEAATPAADEPAAAEPAAEEPAALTHEISAIAPTTAATGETILAGARHRRSAARAGGTRPACDVSRFLAEVIIP